MSYGRASKAPKNTAVAAMVVATANSVTTKEAGSVDISLPAGEAVPMGGIVVNSSEAGSVKSSGAPNMPTTGLAPVDGNRAAGGGWTVTTVAAGSVNFAGHARNVDTTGAGSVKIGIIAAQLPMPATGAGGGNTHGTGRASTTGDTVAVAGDNGQEGGKGAWKVAAAALDLLDLANGDKLRAFLVVIAGAAEMHARGAIGRRILYVSLAMLLVGIAAYQFGWRFPGRPGLHPC